MLPLDSFNSDVCTIRRNGYFYDINTGHTQFYHPNMALFSFNKPVIWNPVMLKQPVLTFVII